MSEPTKPVSCASCGEVLDRAAHLTKDVKPSPGDASVCWYCGHVAIYDEQLGLRAPNDKEMLEIAGDKRFLDIQSARSRFADFWPNDTLKQPRSITCPQCKRTSYNANDIRQRYCGNCHAFHVDLMARKKPAMTGESSDSSRDDPDQIAARAKSAKSAIEALFHAPKYHGVPIITVDSLGNATCPNTSDDTAS